MGLLVYKNTTDITDNVIQNSIKIDDQLNNRANTCSFISMTSITEGQENTIWEFFELTAEALSGQAILSVDNTQQYSLKWKTNDYIWVGIGGSLFKRYKILSIDHTAKTITLTENLTTTLPITTKCGRKIFGGLILEKPDEEMNYDGELEYNVNVSDYSRLFDAKNITAVYENQYSREIIGRVIKKYVANDSELILSSCETLDGWSTEGTATALSLNTSDYAVGAKSIQSGATAGSALWRLEMNTISSTTITSGLVAWYKFEDDFLDSSGNARNLNNNGLGFVDTKLGRGVNLEGNSDQANVTSMSEISRTGTYTVCCWLKFTDTVHDYEVIWANGDGPDGNNNLCFAYIIDKVIYFGIYNGTTYTYKKTATLNENQWYHLACLCNAGNLTLYLDGVVQPTTDTGTHIEDDTARIWGYDLTTNVEYSFDGPLDDLRVYNRVLSLSEIETIISESGQDLTNYDNLKFWLKIPYNKGSKATGLKVQLFTDEYNYWEYTIDTFGTLFEDHWSYNSIQINIPSSTTGSPNITNISYLKIKMTVSSLLSSGDILIDEVLLTEGGFTINNCERGSNIFESIRSNYRKPTVLVDELSKMQNMFWFIDYDRDLHFFADYDETAPFNLDDTSKNYGNLSINADISQIKNVQVVNGGETPSVILHTQLRTCDGEQTSWQIDYKYHTLSVYLDTGSGFVQKTVGIENIDDPADFDFIANFSEKVLKLGSIATPANGTIIKMTYYPYEGISYSYHDSISIAYLKALIGHGDGEFHGAVIDDRTIETWADARARAKAEVDAYKNAIVTADFQTDIDGLKSGQVIHITDSSRSIDDDFLIQKVTRESIHNDKWQYKITAGSSFFGLTEFFQLLLKKTGKIEVSDSTDIIRISVNIDEDFTITDAYTSEVNINTYTVASRIRKVFDFEYLTGTATSNGIIGSIPFSNWVAEFVGQSGGQSISIDKSSLWSNGSSLKLTADTGGDSANVTARLFGRFKVRPSTSYDFSAWYKIDSALGNIGTGGGLRILVKEYADNNLWSSPIATQTILTGQTNWTDYNKSSLFTFTTNSATNYLGIEISIYRASGIVNIGKILIEDNNSETQTNPARVDYSMFS